MRYFTTIGGCRRDSSTEEKVLASSPVMEVGPLGPQRWLRCHCRLSLCL